MMGRPRVGLRFDSLAYALRQSAALVAQVLEGHNLTEAWEACLERHPRWADGVRGAVRDLTWTTLRAGPRCAPILARLLTKPLPNEVRALLMVALMRIEQRPENAHTVVDQAVEATKAFAPGLAGVVNGVLRNRMRNAEEFDRRIALDPSACYGYPDWWIARVRRDHPDAWEAVLLAGNSHPPMSVRPNRRRCSVEQYRVRLESAGIDTMPVLGQGLLLAAPCPVSRLPGFADGWVSVQDAGAQCAAPFLNPQDGERVLDACAAPGGKTAHMLELAELQMTAIDVDATRLQRVGDTLDRLGLKAELRQGDAADPGTWWDGEPFDRILADVPCSASGVVRRHPDIKWLRRDADIPRFAAQQAAILDGLWRTLRPGGTMLYATCSVFDQENGAQIACFCDRHPDVERLSLHGRMDLQLLPNAEHDGFYYALLRKRS